MIWAGAILGAILLGVLALTILIRRRNMHLWLGAYMSQRHPRPDKERDIHVMLCIADHFEPLHGGVSLEVGRQRVRQWVEQYPALVESIRDSDGQTPRHTFFYPAEQYDAQIMDDLAKLCQAGFGEVEIHLHHERDTAENLRKTLSDFAGTLSSRHGLLSRHRQTGQLGYAFIHGNWALDNSHPAGRFCGVNNELDILRQTGCYADFTLPSVPDSTQTRKINGIYWAVDDPQLPKSHDTGIDVGTAARPDDSLMMIQGPLLLDWRNRKWGLLPRIENGCLQASQPPDIRRLDLWLRAAVQVPSRPDWYFVKLHTHGCKSDNQAMLLGRPMQSFYESLARRTADNRHFHVHFLSARQMYNLAYFAENGDEGPISEARDFQQVFSHIT